MADFTVKRFIHLFIVCGDGCLKLADFVQNEISSQTCEEHESLPKAYNNSYYMPMILTNLERKTRCDHLSIQPDKSEIFQFGVTPSISVLKNINKVRITTSEGRG